jgi:hypothetical protein
MFFIFLLSENFVKIIAPVCTRWNSICMMLESIVRMKRVLINVREKRINDLHTLIPEDSDFIVYEAVLPVLQMIRKQSELLSAEVTPTCHLGIPALFYIRDKVLNVIASPPQEATQDMQTAIRTTMEELRDQIEERFPNCGTENRLMCTGHLLHPYYRGSILKKYDKFNETVEVMVNDHPSTAEFATQSRLDRAMIEEEVDPMEVAMAEQTREEANVLTSPLMAEIERYVKLLAPPEKAEVNVLKWWKDNASQFPLLSEVARDYLAVPMTSAPSERAFSSSGKMITSQRTSMAPETASMLSYVQQNWGRLTVRTWKFLDPPSPTQGDEGEGEGEPQPGTSGMRQSSTQPTPALATTASSTSTTSGVTKPDDSEDSD